MVEISKREALLFMGSIIAHNIVEIKGERSGVDCFIDHIIFDWWKKIKVDGLNK
jgi:hypothetical protein